ncbi:MAG: ATP-dependent DNA ligase [Verrucomicrobiota bacterium]
MPNGWKIRYEEGATYLPEIDLWLDSRVPKNSSFVSHAHFDHISRHRRMILSEMTARLLDSRLSNDSQKMILPFGEETVFDKKTRIKLLPAGHIIGSAQLYLKRNERSLLYTGDFKLRPGNSSEPCQAIHADELIMETTYGLPHFVFPSSEEVIREIIRFCKNALDEKMTPVLFCYSLGKSQEILSHLLDEQLPVMLHTSVARMTEIYRKAGVDFPQYKKFDKEKYHDHVLIFPPNTNNSSTLRKIKNRRTAAITGWAMNPGAIYRYQCDEAFPLSDHAGFDDLVHYVQLVNPKRVYTLHGSAREFANHLRKLGYEAWALTGDNQLEFHIETESNKPVKRRGKALTELNTQLAKLCLLLNKCARTTGVHEKVDAISRYLKQLPNSDDISLAVTFLSGRAFSKSSKHKISIGTALLRKVIQKITNLHRGQLREAYLRHQDSGIAFGELLQGFTTESSMHLKNLHRAFIQIAEATNPSTKLNLMQTLFEQLHPEEVKWVVKFITGDLRAGLKEGLLEEAIAKTFDLKKEALAEAHMISGDLALTASKAFLGQLDDITLQYFQPINPMLASPEKDSTAIAKRSSPDWWMEDKMDGIRCQLHKQADRVKLFSRELNEITTVFPEIQEAAKKITQNFILDGELVALQKGRALPFLELQKRLGRKEQDLFMAQNVPVKFFAFDCMKLGDDVLLDQPLNQRRKALETLIEIDDENLLQRLFHEAVQSEETIEEMFQASRRRGNEGLIIKDPESLYKPGKRGMHWLKLKKAYATIDAVVIAVERGHGKRKEYLSDYTFAVKDSSNQLLTIGKAYSGLTNQELEEMTDYFLHHTLKVTKGRYYEVEPKIVVEIAFDSIQPSQRHNSGLALRFPRIHRLRKDKTAQDIDTLEHCQRLMG